MTYTCTRSSEKFRLSSAKPEAIDGGRVHACGGLTSSGGENGVAPCEILIQRVRLPLCPSKYDNLKLMAGVSQMQSASLNLS